MFAYFCLFLPRSVFSCEGNPVAQVPTGRSLDALSEVLDSEHVISKDTQAWFKISFHCTVNEQLVLSLLALGWPPKEAKLELGR